MAKSLKAVAPHNPIRASLEDHRFKPHEFDRIEDLFASRFGWVPPTKRQHLNARLPHEKVVTVGRIGLGDRFIPEGDQ